MHTCSSGKPSSTSSFVSERIETVDAYGVANRHGVVLQPHRRDVQHRAELLAGLAKAIANRAGQLGRQRAFADARRIGLGDAEHGIDRASPTPRPVQTPPIVAFDEVT